VTLLPDRRDVALPGTKIAWLAIFLHRTLIVCFFSPSWIFFSPVEAVLPPDTAGPAGPEPRNFPRRLRPAPSPLRHFSPDRKRRPGGHYPPFGLLSFTRWILVSVCPPPEGEVSKRKKKPPFSWVTTLLFFEEVTVACSRDPPPVPPIGVPLMGEEKGWSSLISAKRRPSPFLSGLFAPSRRSVWGASPPFFPLYFLSLFRVAAPQERAPCHEMPVGSPLFFSSLTLCPLRPALVSLSSQCKHDLFFPESDVLGRRHSCTLPPGQSRLLG